MASSRHPPHSHFSVSHYTPKIFLILLLFLPSASLALNITTLLADHPDLSAFNHLLSSTSVAGDLATRSSLTLLAVPNSFLLRSDIIRSGAADITDVLRYHVLLEYLSWPDLRRIPASGKLVTTLYQTTGRATSNLGVVNLTGGHGGAAVTARSPVPYSHSNATILSLVDALPYNVSIFTVDALLVPYGFDLAASESRPPVGVNITRVLVDGRDFNVAAAMLAASGVAEEFESDERGAGITVFVPTDEAFAGLPATERLQSLPAERKAAVLRFHVLHSYYPLGSLESIVNPVQPTLATENTGAGRFTLNISRVNGSVAIDTGIVEASITRTVFDQNPVAVFAVSRVLLPREIFGREAAAGRQGGVVESEAAPPPVEAAAPPEEAESPPESRDGVTSGASRRRLGSTGAAAICTGLLYLLLLDTSWLAGVAHWTRHWKAATR